MSEIVVRKLGAAEAAACSQEAFLRAVDLAHEIRRLRVPIVPQSRKQCTQGLRHRHGALLVILGAVLASVTVTAFFSKSTSLQRIEVASLKRQPE